MKELACLQEYAPLLSRESLVVVQGMLDDFLSRDRLQDYRPYPKQMEFHAAGRGAVAPADEQWHSISERLLRAGNQSGKSYSAAAEVAMHLTGEYPSYWRGKRYDRPIMCWATGVNQTSTRDNGQRLLIGPPNEWGTGFIPKRCLTSHYGMAKGVTDSVDYIRVRHISGGTSMLRFRYYQQDLDAWMGPPVDLIWFDEEPPQRHYTEGLARTIAVKGVSMMTFTPLQGYTPVVNSFLKDPDPVRSGKHVTQMTWYDVGHMTERDIEAQLEKIPEHEREARVRGDPYIGAGQIFPYAQDEYVIEPIEIPDEWSLLGGLDVAAKSETAHPTGAVMLAWDKDTDTVYVMKEHRRVNAAPWEHWGILQYWGRSLRWSWPKDAANEVGGGESLIELYRDAGMMALSTHAQFLPRSRGGGGVRGQQSIVSVERGIGEIQARLEHGRLKIFNTCPLLISEMRQYSRDETGKIIKYTDDLVDALRMGIMMLRYAVPKNYRRPKMKHSRNSLIGI